MASRAALPAWPRLMDVEMAAGYFGVSASTFRALDIRPCQLGRRVLWDRADLDRYADRLSEQPLTPQQREAEVTEIERRFLRARGRG